MFATQFYYMSNMDKRDAWLQKLGVEGLRSPPEEESEEGTDAGPPAADVERADAGSEPGVRATMEMESPIGTLELLSFSRADKEGRVFDVTIPSSDKVTLVFKAAQSGKSVGTVRISIGGGTKIVLVDVQIASIQMNGSTVQMRLDSSKPAEISRNSDK